MMDRREFLRRGAAAALGLPVLRDTARGASRPGISRYVRLGRTELRISDVSFGSSSSSDPDLVRHALDRGINYFDTAESYRWGRAEEAIGEGIRGVRGRVFLASKTKAGARDDRAEMMRSLEGSLRRLRTDYLDVYFNHAVNDVARMRNEEWGEFTDLARRQGKIRYRGMSGHGSHLAECLDYAIEEDLVDVILVAYNFTQDPSLSERMLYGFHYVALQTGLPPLLKRARKRDIGVVAMKTLLGARLNDMRPFERGGSTYAQAAFRWALSSPDVDALVISMTSRDKIDEYVAASGHAGLEHGDIDLLRRYAMLQAGRYCHHGCGACHGACPEHVPISEVLRARMYAVDYGDDALARASYAELGTGAKPCLTCDHLACGGACPDGLPIADFTREAARHFA